MTLEELVEFLSLGEPPGELVIPERALQVLNKWSAQLPQGVWVDQFAMLEEKSVEDRWG